MGLLRLSLSLVFSENWLILQRIIHTQSLLEGISICENFLMRRVEVVSTIIGISWSMLSLIVWTWERFQWFGDNSLGKTPLSPLHMRSWIAYLWIRNGNWNTYDFMYALYLLLSPCRIMLPFSLPLTLLDLQANVRSNLNLNGSRGKGFRTW
jgi:hypothetical protein